MKKAWIVAGVKLAVGLFLLLSVVGIRILTAPGGSVESEVAELDRLQSTLAKAASAAEEAEEAETSTDAESEAPVASRKANSASLSQRSGADGDADSNRIVACQIAGGRQFMSGGDCAMRGGRATEI